MVATSEETKARVLALLDGLPDAALAEVASFVEFQRYKLSTAHADSPQATRFRPTPLGGLARGVHISEEDIAEIRREMWGSLEHKFDDILVDDE